MLATVRHGGLLVATVAALLLIPAGAASAAVFSVTNSNDSGAGSLRAAIEAANIGPIEDAITFSAGHTITLTSALPQIIHPVSINTSITDACTLSRSDVQIVGNGTFAGLDLTSGGSDSHVCNLTIRGFTLGIEMDQSSRNTVEDSRIGTNASGTAASANSSHGIYIDGGDDNVIGGDIADDRNIISGNGGDGVRLNGTAERNQIAGNLIGIGADGLTAIPNNGGVMVGGSAADSIVGGSVTGQRNVISGNTTYGVSAGAGAVQGNVVGLSFFGDFTVPNGDDGVLVTGPALVGGTTPGARNIISANTDQGVDISITGTGATVQGNWVGTDFVGAPVPASPQGDGILSAVPATITGNSIVGHNHYGVGLAGTSDGSVIEGNRIGISPTVNTSIVAGDTGIDVPAGADDVEIRGNTIAGNSGSGIESGADGLIVEGNTLGLDGDGAATSTSDNEEGINLIGGSGSRIGGTTAAARNVISGNLLDGILVNTGAADTTIEGNWIGVGGDGVTARPNGAAGVELRSNGAATVGGTAAGAGNVIAHNGTDGVRPFGIGSYAVLGNRIFGHGAALPLGMGIDVAGDGPTANDPGDADTGVNGLQNFPVLTFAETDGATTDVDGTIDTTPGRSIRVELFSTPSCDTSGSGEGETFLGATTVTAGAGPTAFGASVGGTTAGHSVTATATDLTTNQTSEFSACRTATAVPVLPEPDPDPNPSGGGAATSTPSGETPPAATPKSPKFPAKIRVLRNGVDDGVLDMLIEITARAKTTGAELDIAYQSSGRTTRFSVPITGTQIKVRKKLPSSQPKDTGITTVTYAGNDLVDPDEVRLRAADGKSRLVRAASSVSSGVLNVNGTISSRARGVVRIRLSYAKPDASTGLLDYRATISKGTWKLAQTLPAEAARGGQLSIQFTGYEAENLRGEQTAKEVLG